MSDIDKYVQERCKKSPEFKKAWEDSKTETEMILSMIDARESANLTQSQLAEITGIDQGSISRIENGEGNPTIAKLKKIANGMNAQLKILFVPSNH